MASAGEQEGDALVKKGRKFREVSLFAMRTKPDWAQAGPLLERGAQCFRRARCHAKALAAFQEASVAQERLGSPWHAAKLLEQAAGCARDLGDPDQAVDLTVAAMTAYVDAGRVMAGAEGLAKGAQALRDASPPHALRLFLDALEMYEDGAHDSAAALAAAGEAFRETVQLLVSTGDLARAAEVLIRFGAFNSAGELGRATSKAYVSAVAVYLCMGRGRDALAAFNDCSQVPGFSATAGQLLDGLLDCARGGDAEALRAHIQRSGLLLEVDNCVARLVKKLPDKNLSALAAELEAEMGAGLARLDLNDLDDEDDLC